MSEKVVLTKEQAEVVEQVKKVFLGKRMLEVSKAVQFGYEVEPQYKVGDWVYITSNIHGSKGSIRRITEIKKSCALGEDVHYKLDGSGVYFKSYIRHATPEEIKAEKERRLWKSVGREVGELRKGDIYISKDDLTYSYDGLERNKFFYDSYNNGIFKGFYPAGSFIEFGGGEE